jgi:uncharacterized membrane protein YkvA (DUF1232 family)
MSAGGAGWLERSRAWARGIKRDGMTLWYAASHPGTPWYAKAMGLLVVGYALSPIDLIPDFIPVLGYLDDVILLPALIWLTIRMLPAPVLADCRQRAEQWMAQRGSRPRSVVGAVVIVVLWVALLGAAAWWLLRDGGPLR